MTRSCHPLRSSAAPPDPVASDEGTSAALVEARDPRSMPGRKQPEMNDNERRREYRMFEKRAYGEVEPHSGVPAEVAKEREEWARDHPKGSSKKT